MTTAPAPPYLLAIDAGTEAIKAGLFDSQGNSVAVCAQPYQSYFPRPGWAEQDAEEWWCALVMAVRGCVEMAAVPVAEIAGISADATTCTLIPMTADGRPLRRALLWMDVRAAQQAARIHASGHPALCYSPAGVNAEWMPPKMLWLKENEPQIYAEMAYLLEFTDWIAYRLTGRFALNLNTITQRWYYHKPSGGWPIDFLEQIGLGDLPTQFPVDVLGVGEIVGGLSSAAAEDLGLPVGIPVVSGGGDAFIGLLGLGVTEPGDLGVIMGSSNVLAGLARDEFHAPGLFGGFPDAVIPGLNLVEAGQVSTGSLLAWFKRNFCQNAAAEAAERGLSIYQLLDAEAAQVPLGSEGLIVLDSFQGNRTPHTDSSVRGAIWGLSLQSGRGQIFRALMEGIAYGTQEILLTLRQQGFAVARILACGGATRSPLQMQIYADVTGQPFYVTAEAEGSLLGSAVVAATGAGLYADLAAASRAMVSIRHAYHPNRERHDAYQFYVEKYRETYYQLRDLMHAMSAHQAQSY